MPFDFDYYAYTARMFAASGAVNLPMFSHPSHGDLPTSRTTHHGDSTNSSSSSNCSTAANGFGFSSGGSSIGRNKGVSPRVGQLFGSATSLGAQVN